MKWLYPILHIIIVVSFGALLFWMLFTSETVYECVNGKLYARYLTYLLETKYYCLPISKD